MTVITDHSTFHKYYLIFDRSIAKILCVGEICRWQTLSYIYISWPLISVIYVNSPDVFFRKQHSLTWLQTSGQWLFICGHSGILGLEFT